MEDSQPKMVLEHLYSMCQSLKATNRISLHIRMMNILYEFIQTINYFRFLRDKLKEAPILDIDCDVDYKEWANKKWLYFSDFSLLREDKNTYGYEPEDKEAKTIVDYLFTRDEKMDRKRRDKQDIIELRKELAEVAENLRTSIDVILGHSAITTNTVNEGIKKASDELREVLLEINDIIEGEKWSDEQYTDLVYRYMPKVTETSVMLRKDVKEYRAQKNHETLREEFFRNKLNEVLAIFIKTDFIIDDYLTDDYAKEDKLWSFMGMESRRDIDDTNINKKRLYILTELLPTNCGRFDFYDCPKLGKYLFYKRRDISDNLNPLKSFFVMSTLIMDDWDKFNDIPVTRTDIKECKFTEEQINASNIPQNAWLFLTLVSKIIPRNSEPFVWVYVLGVLKTSKRFGYNDTLKNFHANILCSILDVKITYDAMKTAKNRAIYINKDYTLQDKAYSQDKRIAELNRSIEAHFRQRVEEIKK